MPLQQPASGTASAGEGCFHCGLPLPAESRYRVTIDGQPRAMCCPGCQAVAQAIVKGGLESYYRHRAALPASPKDTLPAFLKELQLYDLPEVQQSFVTNSAEHEREASLILEGLTCAACVWLNEQHLSRLPGVLGAHINYATQRVRVRWDESRIKLSEILQAVAAIGYTAHPFDPGRQEELHRRQRKSALWQLFVAGFGMMQVMMYAVPVYLAGEGEMTRDIEQLMRWASLILTLPVVFYSSAPFFIGTWRDLRIRRVGMDVPVALGIGIAFLASVWATLQGTGEVYFDSIAMFVFFLLCGRFLEQGARAKASEAAERLVKLIPALATRLPDYPASKRDEPVAVSLLRVGEHALVRPGEAVPADGRVVEGVTGVDESLLTGESLPVQKKPGDALTGGAVNIASPVIMKVEWAGQDTVLSAILRLLDRALAEKPRLVTLADQVASWFVAALLVLAVGVAAAWYVIDPSKALWITVAVLVVTCPCALSLATPAALAAATGALTRMGLLVTRGHALETLAKATHFVFDKTGTLTFGRMAVREVKVLGDMPQEQCLALARSLEQGSEHPIAKALIEAAGADTNAPQSGELVNVPGSGIEGTVEGRRYRLGGAQFVAQFHGQPVPGEIGALQAGGVTVIALGDETQWLAGFAVGDTLRPEARRAVSELKRRGKRVVLLSGDTPGTAREIGSRVGVDDVIAGVMPEQKLEYVRSLQRRGAIVVMVGDGVNDAPVLAQAEVSIAMGEGTQVAQASADMVLLSGRLSSLPAGHAIALKAQRIIRQNIAWAIAYNLLALPLAVMGYVTPWMAGIGMASSSLLVVLNALRLTRQDSGSRIQDRVGQTFGNAGDALESQSSILNPRS